MSDRGYPLGALTCGTHVARAKALSPVRPRRFGPANHPVTVDHPRGPGRVPLAKVERPLDEMTLADDARSGGLAWADGEGMSSPQPQPPGNQHQVAASILAPEVPRCIGRESSACPNRHKGMTCKPAWIDMRMSVPTRSVMTFPLGPAERSSCTHEQVPSEAPRSR